MTMLPQGGKKTYRRFSGRLVYCKIIAEAIGTRSRRYYRREALGRSVVDHHKDETLPPDSSSVHSAVLSGTRSPPKRGTPPGAKRKPPFGHHRAQNSEC
jgi:hypothetical protein